jgi:acylglycerol lipase
MRTETWNWKTEDGLEMYAQEWAPEAKVKAVVCLLHGLGEHTGRYAHVGAIFAKAGYVFSGFDLRGHGRSGGQRGHFPSLAALMEDIHRYIALARKRHPGIPVFLYGHSLGALLALTYATCRQHTLTGVIVTGAGLRSPLLEQKAKMALSKALGRLFPTLAFPTGLDPEGISRDPEVVRVYRQDPLVHGVATLAAARAGIEAVEWAFAHASEFPVPLLLMQGGADRITYPCGSQEYADLVGSGCRLRIWDGLYHEIHNEPEQAEVLKFAITWMNSLLKKK